MKKKKIICENCGRIIDGEHQEYEGKAYCRECFEEEFYYCEDCENYYPRDDFYYVEGENKYVCSNCIDNYYQCQECDEYFSDIDTNYVNDPNGSGYRICDNCRYNGNYEECEDCGYLFHVDDLHYHERDDRYYCDD